MRKIKTVICAFLLLSFLCSFAFADEAEVVSITVKNGADVKLFSQVSNYNTVEIEEKSVITNGGNTTYVFSPKNYENLSYRAEKDGYITKAGYVQKGQSVNIEFFEDEDILSPKNDVAVIQNRLENSVLLSVNSKNFVHMKENEKYSYTAYRTWQIINKDTQNIIIEPDFLHEIVHGKGCVEIENTEDFTNAGNNRVTLRAINEGVSIIEVSYSATDIGGDTRYVGRYGASEKNRNGALIVKVGGECEAVDIGFNWDSERDTVYFTGENGAFTVFPTSKNSSVKEVEVLHLNDGENAQFEKVLGTQRFNIPVKEGNNAVRITLENGKEDYFIVRGKRVSVNVENASGFNKINPGDTLKIHIDGLYLPIPKMGGIYNPYQNKLVYKDEAENEYSSKAKQYDFASEHSLEITVPSDFSGDEYVLKNGCIYTEMYCSETVTHRNMGNDGTSVNINAVLIKQSYSILPDIKIFLGEEKTIYGDVNEDGKVNSRDIAFIQRLVVLNGEYTDKADVNHDGKINSRDIAYIQKLIISGSEV